MVREKIVEYVFFFGLLAAVAYLVWKLIAPFAAALALAAIIVTICYPLFGRVQDRIPWKNKSLAAGIATVLVLLIVIAPVIVIGSFLFREALSIYALVNTGGPISLEQSLGDLEVLVQSIIPGFSLDITAYIQQIANLVATNIGSIFTGTASTVFLFFIAILALFYFFRDGNVFTKYLVQVSPLPDDEDEIILGRMARAVRSVALGIVLVAIIQGILTAIGLALFGFERAVLLGSVAAIGALVPGIGTSIVFLPVIGYLVFIGEYWTAAGLALWASIAVGLIDNLLGPYLMSRGNKMHPFLILLSVLGGIVMFGPIGFVLGPVVLSLLLVLLELYATHIANASESKPQQS